MPSKKSTLLVSMPFAGVIIPSIQLPILDGYGRHHQLDVSTRHLYLKAAEFYGLAHYHALIHPPSDSYTAQMAFSQYLFPDHWEKNKENIKDYYNKHVEALSFSFEDYLRTTDDFYHWATEKINWQDYDLIGFTLNYGQLLPSLAIAKYIKQQNPEKKIVLGGSRVADTLGRGILRAFDYIDYCVSGDGEEALVQLTSNQDLTSIPGLTYRNDHEIHQNPPFAIDLATQPIPSYDPFFNELRASSNDLQQFFHYYGRLPLEISRGCWWNRCTFCNLNIQHPGYREKPIPNIIAELQALSDRYHILDYQLIGNTLPKTTYRALFEAIRNLNRDFTFFVEARAGHLTCDDYRLMKDAGFTTIQTGIESFSTHYLHTMNKGTRVIDNIAALKFCKQHAIVNHYNLIARYPNETPQDFQETQTIAHTLQRYLDAPQLCDLRIMYGSPIHQHPDKYNIATLQHAPLDLLMYPPEILADDFAFVYSYTTTQPTPTHEWETLVQDWKTARETADKEAMKTRTTNDQMVFYSVDGGSFMKVYDKRDPQHIRILELNTIERQVLLACTDIISCHSLQDQFAFIPDFELDTILQSFEHAGLVYHEDDLYLSLPLLYRSKTAEEDQKRQSIPTQVLMHS